MDVRIRRWAVPGGWGRAALLPPSAFAVHQLRYLLAYGSGAGAELRETGHSYFHSVVPGLVALIALTAGGFLVGVGRAFARDTTTKRFTLSFTGLWLASSMALIGVFCVQELLEGLFATGHPGGLAGVFGYGGWWSIPAAACVGLVLAALLHSARWVVERVWRYRTRRSLRVHRPPRAPRLRIGVVVKPAPLFAGWCTRGPPA